MARPKRYDQLVSPVVSSTVTADQQRDGRARLVRVGASLLLLLACVVGVVASGLDGVSTVEAAGGAAGSGQLATSPPKPDLNKIGSKAAAKAVTQAQYENQQMSQFVHKKSGFHNLQHWQWGNYKAADNAYDFGHDPTQPRIAAPGHRRHHVASHKNSYYTKKVLMGNVFTKKDLKSPVLVDHLTGRKGRTSDSNWVSQYDVPMSAGQRTSDQSFQQHGYWNGQNAPQ